MELPAGSYRYNRGMSDRARARAKVDFDGLMQHLMVLGFAALTAWTIVSTTGLALGIVRISPSATLRFLVAVLVLVFARRTYWELREWHWRRLPPDERYGFANPIREHPRATELDGAGTTVESPETPAVG